MQVVDKGAGDKDVAVMFEPVTVKHIAALLLRTEWVA
ncbi:hypothetical protein SDC9_164554 [bioreactor metagenome]|uniref:Uncharacterized protein n=1 Tax=bioreactor metagenome TaxID=1076179 RepID=A0A645FZA7_9ZZZZ